MNNLVSFVLRNIFRIKLCMDGRTIDLISVTVFFIKRIINFFAVTNIRTIFVLRDAIWVKRLMYYLTICKICLIVFFLCAHFLQLLLLFFFCSFCSFDYYVIYQQLPNQNLKNGRIWFILTFYELCLGF